MDTPSIATSRPNTSPLTAAANSDVVNRTTADRTGDAVLAVNQPHR